jgi:hypothetical protein
MVLVSFGGHACCVQAVIEKMQTDNKQANGKKVIRFKIMSPRYFC